MKDCEYKSNDGFVEILEGKFKGKVGRIIQTMNNSYVIELHGFNLFIYKEKVKVM